MMYQEIEGLNKLQGEWENFTEIIPYGAGLEAYRTLKRIINDFNVPYIIDIDEKKRGKKIYGVPIVNVDKIIDRPAGSKILVTVAKRRFQEIKEVLESYGLHENIDFCHISQFGMEWYYKFRKEYCIFTMDIAITTYCTLKCKKCNMFIPYYEKPIMYKFDEFKESVDLLFSRIDYVFALGILGGEALINPDIIQIIEYLRTYHQNKVGSILVTTNGLTIPNKEILECFKNNEVIVTISDYRASVQDRSKLEELEEIFTKNRILFTLRESLVWCDFGFPENPADISDEDCRKHMLGCDPGWRGLNDGKFYFCNVAWSAEKAGLIRLNDDDFIDLRKLDLNDEGSKRTLLNYSLGNLTRRYMSFCKSCRGCGEDNHFYVNAGEQMNG